MTEEEKTALIGLVASVGAGASIGALLNYAVKGKVGWAAPIAGALAGAAAKYGYDWYNKPVNMESEPIDKTDKVAAPVFKSRPAETRTAQTVEQLRDKLSVEFERSPEEVEAAMAFVDAQKQPIVRSTVAAALGAPEIPKPKSSENEQILTNYADAANTADMYWDVYTTGAGGLSTLKPLRFLKGVGRFAKPFSNGLGYFSVGSNLVRAGEAGRKNYIDEVKTGRSDISDAALKEYDSWLKNPSFLSDSFKSRFFSGAQDVASLKLLRTAPYLANLPHLIGPPVTASVSGKRVADRKPFQNIAEAATSLGVGGNMLGENIQREYEKGGSALKASFKGLGTLAKQIYTPGTYMDKDVSQPGVDFELYRKLLKAKEEPKEALKKAEKSWLSKRPSDRGWRASDQETQKAEIDWPTYNAYRQEFLRQGMTDAEARRGALRFVFELGGTKGGKLKFPDLSK